MTGLALLFLRTGRPVAVGELTPILEAMGTRGPDGRDVAVEGPCALGHLHHWTTPEEIGERQPLRSPDGRFLLAFDGRLDNRDELIAATGATLPAEPPSDAAVVLAGLAAGGAGFLARLLGPFALAAWDDREARVLLATDPMGSRSLVFHLSPQRLVAATDELGVLAGPGVDGCLDEGRLDLHFALREPVDDATFFRSVRNLLPGELLAVEGDRLRRTRPLRVAVAGDPVRDPAAALRNALEQSVAARLRSARRVGVMMSGGLDSTSIAAVASGLTAPREVPTLSWRFSRFPACDEGPYLEAMARTFPLAPVDVPGDDAWPRVDEAPVYAAIPSQNPYRGLHEATYDRARRSDLGVVLTGMFGDQLYTGRGQPTPLSLLRRGIAAGTPVRSTTPGVARRLLRGGGLLVPRLRRAPWLRADVRRRLPPDPPWPPEIAEARRPLQAARLLDPRTAEGNRAEGYFASRFAVEVRNPYRDRRVVELLLALPTRELRHGRVHRPVLRRAMSGSLPESVRRRPTKTTFQPLFEEGLAGSGRPRAERLLWARERAWPAWVRESWLRKSWDSGRLDGIAGLVVWECLAFEMWRARQEAHR
jgi:asparagine synthase (glutamine-hydrolysing)